MTAAELSAGVTLDILIGDPRWLPHPVRAIGTLANALEHVARRSPLPLRIAGGLFWIAVVGATATAVHFTMPWANVYWVFAFLAIRSLDSEAARVMHHLSNGDLAAARQHLATIVGRDTESLTEPEIVRAVIETVSENLSDGVVAPLFWLAVGGPVAMAAYKAVNTLDSMVGYRNERYRDFGYVSARMDDLASWIPARLTAALVVLISPRALHVVLRDGASQPSPNSGYPEAAFAGALGLQLGGTSTYRGVPSRKATLGDNTRPLTTQVWREARRLFWAVSLLAAAIAIGVAAW